MTMESIYREIGICSQVLNYGERVEASLKKRFEGLDETAEYNQLKCFWPCRKTA